MAEPGIRSPARLVPLAFLAAIGIGTALLLLPFARAGQGGAPFLTALFTATSAVCVTGLNVEDMVGYWTPFGQVVILCLFQVGGFGIMTSATLLGLLVSRRLGLRRRLVAHAETRSLALGDVTEVLWLVLRVTLAVEALTACILTLRLALAYGEPWPAALWHGVFQAISAFNNAGFSTYSDSLMGFAADPFVLLPIMLAVVIGGLGFPVLHELRHELREPARWSIHTKITLTGTLLLLAVGAVLAACYEWGNPATLGPLEPGAKLLNAMMLSVMPRSSGFNSVDTGRLATETQLISYGLMLIGGGSASTAGGIKVTTFCVLVLAAWAEIRGETDTTAFRRRVPPFVQRQALTVVLLAALTIGAATLIMLTITPFSLDQVLFEVISAFATVGLSTGITPDLPPAAQLVVVVLMFMGRVGTTTLATALALREHSSLYRYPEERPIVG
jgi:trk system potassium uptake protein TrkH